MDDHIPLILHRPPNSPRVPRWEWWGDCNEFVRVDR